MALKLEPVNMLCNTPLLKLDLQHVILTTFIYFSSQVLIKSFETNRNRQGEKQYELSQSCSGEYTVDGVSTNAGLENSTVHKRPAQSQDARGNV